MGNICAAPGDNDVIVYGDRADSGTRTILNILDFSGINYKFESISKWEDEDKGRRDAFKAIHPEEFVPLLSHGGVKIAGNVELILLYLVKVFPAVNKQVFNDDKIKDEKEKEEHKVKMSKDLAWVKKCLTPNVAELFKKIESDAEAKVN